MFVTLEDNILYRLVKLNVFTSALWKKFFIFIPKSCFQKKWRVILKKKKAKSPGATHFSLYTCPIF